LCHRWMIAGVRLKQTSGGPEGPPLARGPMAGRD
jgi:hypothetical protein